MQAYWKKESARSIDGLEGLKIALEAPKEFKNAWKGIEKVPKHASLRVAPKTGPDVRQLHTWLDIRVFVGVVIGVVLSFVMSDFLYTIKARYAKVHVSLSHFHAKLRLTYLLQS